MKQDGLNQLRRRPKKKAQLKQWVYRGKLKAVKTPGGHYRIPEAELDSFLHQPKRPLTSR